MLTNEPFCKVLQKNAMFTLLWTRSNRSFKHDSLTIKTAKMKAFERLDNDMQIIV